jgi:hypothetical protein
MSTFNARRVPVPPVPRREQERWAEVLLPVELDYTAVELYPFWQRCGANQEAEILRATQSVTTIPECLQFGLLPEATRVPPRTCGIDSVLSQAMPKLTVYGSTT